MLLRDGIDLDELDAELRGYKIVLGIYPQGRLDPSAQPMSFSFGVTDAPNVTPVFSDAIRLMTHSTTTSSTSRKPGASSQ
jgi:hypothetical protein